MMQILCPGSGPVQIGVDDDTAHRPSRKRCDAESPQTLRRQPSAAAKVTAITEAYLPSAAVGCSAIQPREPHR
jgi:hypothetical protein